MLYTLITILLAVWLIGLLSHVGGSFIHGLLVLCGVLFIFQLATAGMSLRQTRKIFQNCHSACSKLEHVRAGAFSDLAQLTQGRLFFGNI